MPQDAGGSDDGVLLPVFPSSCSGFTQESDRSNESDMMLLTAGEGAVEQNDEKRN